MLNEYTEMWVYARPMIKGHKCDYGYSHFDVVQTSIGPVVVRKYDGQVIDKVKE
jgi:hypothetical protein